MISQLKNRLRAWLRLAFYGFYQQLLNRRRINRETSQFFPLCHGKNYFYDALKNENDDRLFFSKYHQDNTENPLAVEFSKYRSDIVSGTFVAAGKKYKLDLKSPSAVPVSVSLEGREKINVIGDYTVDVCVDGKPHSLNKLVGDRFHYLPFHEPCTVEINSPHNLIVGDPLSFVQTKRNKKKLVVLLYVDSFTSEIFSYLDKDKDLPNITRFFAKGARFTNCHSISEWTLPSVATIVSGKHPLQHGLFDPKGDAEIGLGYPLMSERFRDAGYLTFQAVPFWRTSPTYGYTKGYDRTVYKRHMSLEETFSSAYENIRAFPQRDQFLWMPFSEAHNHVNLLPDISAQVRAPLDGHNYGDQRRGPIRTESASQRYRYIEELKRIDFYLGQFFRFIEDNYSEDELLVGLFSDHGVRYLRDTPHLLATDATHVPFYLRGAGVKAGDCDEFFSTADIPPTMLDLMGLPPLEDIHGRIANLFGGPPPRTEVVSESYFPGRPYNAAVKNKDYEFFLVSQGIVDQKGRFEMGTPNISLYHFGDYSKDISSDNEETTSRLYGVLKNHLDELK